MQSDCSLLKSMYKYSCVKTKSRDRVGQENSAFVDPKAKSVWLSPGGAIKVVPTLPRTEISLSFQTRYCRDCDCNKEKTPNNKAHEICIQSRLCSKYNTAFLDET